MKRELEFHIFSLRRMVFDVPNVKKACTLSPISASLSFSLSRISPNLAIAKVGECTPTLPPHFTFDILHIFFRDGECSHTILLLSSVSLSQHQFLAFLTSTKQFDFVLGGCSPTTTLDHREITENRGNGDLGKSWKIEEAECSLGPPGPCGHRATKQR